MRDIFKELLFLNANNKECSCSRWKSSVSLILTFIPFNAGDKMWQTVF